MTEVDYGYGSDNEDYGYGDASAEEDYGYGDSSPDEYGYEDTEEPVMKAPAEEKRPKRRCSVTKFNLDNSDALTAADRIREMRNNDDTPIKSDDGFQTDEMSSDDTDGPVETSKEKKKAIKKQPKGALSRLRKRLSIAF